VVHDVIWLKYLIYGQIRKAANLIQNIARNCGLIAVAQLVEALRYKPERRGFDSRWCHWFRSHYVPVVDSASNRNEYQVFFRGGGGVKAAGA
jgi:hypothetical protein